MCIIRNLMCMFFFSNAKSFRMKSTFKLLLIPGSMEIIAKVFNCSFNFETFLSPDSRFNAIGKNIRRAIIKYLEMQYISCYKQGIHACSERF